MSKNDWYAVRCLIFDKDNSIYEERTVLVRAPCPETALGKAEAEAIEYCSNIGNLSYTGYCEEFQLMDRTISDLTEIYSFMRKSSLGRDEYIKDTSGRVTRSVFILRRLRTNLQA